ncbi:MAG: hypothetical protein AAF961_11415, partial [Planctomycetota bacterium]
DAEEATRQRGEHAPESWAAFSDASRQDPSVGNRLVNSRAFDIEYDLQTVGPWGVARVELWGTRDGGRTWNSFGVDPDNRSPIRVVTPGSGAFGFRIVVDGANSPPSTPPQPGDRPEMYVSVDLTPPDAQLLSVGQATVDGVERLLIRWSAADENLERLPIALLYSSSAEGPWSAIATGLENSGSYRWRLERHLPNRFYVRLEARDRAGNVAAYQSASPIVLDRPPPRGRLRDVRAAPK